jgi:hypothetical protein
MSHAYHDALPGFSPDQLLFDGCPECEHRGQDAGRAIAMLDAANFRRAWRRAYDCYASAGDRQSLVVSDAETPLLDALWSVQLQLERIGVPLAGDPLT